MSRITRDDTGAAATEQVVVVALVALVALAAWDALGESTTERTRCVTRALWGSATPCAPEPTPTALALGEGAPRTLASTSALTSAPQAQTLTQPQTPTPTRTPTRTPTPAPTRTLTPAPTRTLTQTLTPAPTQTPTPTRTPPRSPPPSARISPLSPVVILSLYPRALLGDLLAAVRRHRIARPTYVGSYGVDTGQARRVRALAHGRYAPMFGVDRPLDLREKGGYYWAARRNAPVRPGDARGALIPALADLVTHGPADVIAWGRELGRRYRDEIRTRGEGLVDTWQLDEIWPSLASPGPTASARRFRETARYFMAGIVSGMYGGRPELGDRPMKGLVWIAHHNDLAALRSPAAHTLLAAIDRAALRILGEQYHAFTGDPIRRAQRDRRAQQLLWQRNGRAMRSLARKYVAGMMAGRRRTVPGSDPRAWQRRYIEAHRGTVAGIAMFNWTGKNGSPRTVETLIGAIARAVR